MQLPHENAHYSQRVDFGTYVVRRLKRAQFTSLATDAALATAAVKAKGRAWEDRREPVQDALADRDAADDALEDKVKDLRANLAGRSASASKEIPYTSIFPQGIGYYTAAPVDEEIKRYTELGERANAHLPSGDAIKAPSLQANAQGIADYTGATTALTQAKIQESMAKTDLDQAEEAWNRLMEKIYGTLVAEIGKKAAERFFPRPKGKSKGRDSDAADEG